MTKNRIEALSASNLISSVTIAALLRCLTQKGLLSTTDIRELYEAALLLLESQQGLHPSRKSTFGAAREVFEKSLKAWPAAETAKPTDASGRRR